MTLEEIDIMFPPSYSGNAQISDLRNILTRINTNGELGARKLNELTDVDTETVPPNLSQVLKYNGLNWVPNDESQGALEINDLTDVIAPTPGNDQVLKYNGLVWTPANEVGQTYTAGPGLDLTLNDFSLDATTEDLNDVTFLSLPTTGQILAWDGARWVPTDNPNATYSAGLGLNLIGTTFALASGITNLQDVDTTSAPPNAGQVLKWNSSSWVPADDTGGGGGGGTETSESFIVTTAQQVSQGVTLGQVPDTGYHLFVYLNGMYQTIGAAYDYTLSATTLTFHGHITQGDTLTVKYTY